ncbi:MAG: heterodisulfide reductase-related iron-sulfur binding cluster [Candidatus Bathyarchaeia archaeon]
MCIFPGCIAKSDRYACELSLRNVLPEFEVELIYLNGANCCGYSHASIIHPSSWTYLSTRDIALAEETRLCYSLYVMVATFRSAKFDPILSVIQNKRTL